MIDSTNPRIMADNIRALSGEAGSQAADISTLQTTVETQGDAIEALETGLTAIGTYSTTEVKTGKKYNGSDVYSKLLILEEPLAVAYTSYTDTGIAIEGADIIVNCEGYQPSAHSYVGSLLAVYSYDTLKVQTQKNGNTATVEHIYVEYTKSAAPTPDLSPAPDDTRSIEPEEVREAPEEEPITDEPIEEPVVEVKKTTRKKTTTTE